MTSGPMGRILGKRIDIVYYTMMNAYTYIL